MSRVKRKRANWGTVINDEEGDDEETSFGIVEGF